MSRRFERAEAARGKQRRAAERPEGGLSLPASVVADIRLLMARLEELLDAGGDGLAVMLETQEQILRRVNDNRALLMAILQRLEGGRTGPAESSGAGPVEHWEDAVLRSPPRLAGDLSLRAPGNPLGLNALPDSRVADYEFLVARIRAMVRASVPVDATVLVVSRGDDELLRLDGRRAWHFPRSHTGQYAGHHPADGEEAIAHLEELRRNGADYLVLPRTAFWWMGHYPAFRAHLEGNYVLVVRDEMGCVIFSLTSPPEFGRSSGGSR